MTSADWVDVADEPHHVEAFRNDRVRVFDVSIAPGTATRYHRHTLDTIYVLTGGGRFRSDEPVVQQSRTRVGRSTPLPRKLAWLAGRTLTGGWLAMPAGTLLMQYHAGYPLVHRIVAAERNAAPVRMVGIELQGRGDGDAPPDLPGAVEYADDNARTHRLALAPGASCELGALRAGGVLVVLAGEATLRSAGAESVTGPGSATWIGPGGSALHNAAPAGLDCFVTALA